METTIDAGEVTPPKRYAGLKPPWTAETRPAVGRPLGARNRLAERFWKDLYEDWRKHGAAAIARVREQDPSTYFKVCASLQPREDKLTVLAKEVSALTVADARHLLALLDEAEKPEPVTIEGTVNATDGSAETPQAE